MGRIIVCVCVVCMRRDWAVRGRNVMEIKPPPYFVVLKDLLSQDL